MPRRGRKEVEQKAVLSAVRHRVCSARRFLYRRRLERRIPEGVEPVFGSPFYRRRRRIRRLLSLHQQEEKRFGIAILFRWGRYLAGFLWRNSKITPLSPPIESTFLSIRLYNTSDRSMHILRNFL